MLVIPLNLLHAEHFLKLTNLVFGLECSSQYNVMIKKIFRLSKHQDIILSHLYWLKTSFHMKNIILEKCLLLSFWRARESERERERERDCGDMGDWLSENGLCSLFPGVEWPYYQKQKQISCWTEIMVLIYFLVELFKSFLILEFDMNETHLQFILTAFEYEILNPPPPKKKKTIPTQKDTLNYQIIEHMKWNNRIQSCKYIIETNEMVWNV